MTETERPTRGVLRVARRGWPVMALFVLWVQLVAGAHYHAEAGDAPGHRVWSCDLCLAHASPAAAPPLAAALPLPVAALPARGPYAAPAPGPTDRSVPHSPRAPPRRSRT